MEDGIWITKKGKHIFIPNKYKIDKWKKRKASDIHFEDEKEFKDEYDRRKLALDNASNSLDDAVKRLERARTEKGKQNAQRDMELLGQAKTTASQRFVDYADARIVKDTKKNIYMKALNKIAEDKDAIERATYGDILPRGGWDMSWSYDNMVKEGNKINKKNPDNWTAKQSLAARLAKADEKYGSRKAMIGYGNMRVLAKNDNYISTVSNQNGYDDFNVITSDGRRNRFYDRYPDVFIEKGHDNITARLQYGSIGSMDAERARHELNKIDSAIEHVEKLNKIKTKYMYGNTRELMNLNEIIKYYEQQGLSKETARKMANWYIKNRKNK